MLQPGADPVRKVSIIPRGGSLGVTFQSPAADRYAYGEPYLRGRIVGLLGGHAAEQIVYGEATSGAESAASKRHAGCWRRWASSVV